MLDIATILAAVAAILLVFYIDEMVRRHGFLVLLCRFLTGGELDGEPRTNAGWLAPGDKPLTRTGRASRWHHRPRIHRAGIRLTVIAGSLSLMYGVGSDPRATVQILSGTLAVAVLGSGVVVWFVVRDWNHHRKYTHPLHVALGDYLGIPEATNAKSWVKVPRDFLTNQSAAITLQLPPKYRPTREAKATVIDTVSAKLGLPSDDMVTTFHLVGSNPHVQFTVLQQPPKKLKFADALEHFRAATSTTPFIGLGRAGKVISAELVNDSPHILMSAGSGGGKSVTIRTVISQVMHNGGLCLILDIKRISHMWARGLPNVKYLRNIKEIHDWLMWVAGEVDARNLIVDNHADENGEVPDGILGPRIFIVAEEMNATSGKLQTYWRSIKKPEDPAMSPAIQALGDVTFMGRAVDVNVLAVAQMFTARTAGGPESRENYGTRILARYTANNWKMLVPEIWPMPKMRRHTGRVQVCMSGVAHETQVAFMTPSEAREWASSGTIAEFPAAADLPQLATTPARRSDLGELPVSATATLPVASGYKVVGLGEACRTGVLTIKIAAARSARARDPEFPKPIGQDKQELRYSADALERWEKNRIKSEELVQADELV